MIPLADEHRRVPAPPDRRSVHIRLAPSGRGGFLFQRQVQLLLAPEQDHIPVGPVGFTVSLLPSLAMNAELVWSDALSLSMPAMDVTHQEFVDLLAKVQTADDTELMPRWQELVEHTDAHFAREDRWMRETGFAPENCHSTQHAVVLKVLREGSERGKQGDYAPIRQMAHELTIWFPHHAQNMDFGLALHLKSMGYDPETGQISQPHKLPAEAIAGCGGACSNADTNAESSAESSA